MPEPRRAGALVVRVWLEGTAEDPRLRVRLFGRADVTREATSTASVSTIDDALVLIRDWLDDFYSSESGRRQDEQSR